MDTRIKWLAPLAIALAMIAVACTGDGEGDYSLVSGGNLTVCTDAPYEPFEFQDAAGAWTGFDMDILREVASGLDLELDVKVVPFDGIWLLPAAGECDIVGSAMTITEERAASALFSDPYFDADQSLLVRAAEADTYATLESLTGRNIGVQTGTTGEQYAQDNRPEGSTLISFDEPAAMFLALESTDVDAILQDLPVNGFRSTQDEAFVVTETFSTGEQYGFAVDPANTALIEAVNGQLSEMRDSGRYDEIFAKWFGV
ncbi:MAG: transporter substrate-binding domain-containing protein [Dehalococcoidia bacterium]|nr:transporter substrate-binding domain-containing protein [Dehalococcoidia bacterium]